MGRSLRSAHRSRRYRLQGHDSDTVALVTPDAPSLLGYFEAVHNKTLAFIGSLSDPDLVRVVDRNWDPPVTLGVRLVSVISDDLQHVGRHESFEGFSSGAGRSLPSTPSDPVTP